MHKRNVIWGVLWLIAVINPLSLEGLESSMAGYMLLQVPGLIIGGYFLGKALGSHVPEKWAEFDRTGAASLFVAIFTILYWILPRSVDAALNEPAIEILKLVSLPVLAGIPLAWSWQRLNSLVKGLVLANLVSMMFVMSWLYLSAPIRICNNFLEQQQNLLGKALLLAGLALAVYLVLPAFIGKSDTNRREKIV